MPKVINATRVFGSTIVVDPNTFLDIANTRDECLIVTAKSGFFKTYFSYLMHHAGFSIYTRSESSLELPAQAELIVADRIHSPVN